MDRDEFYQLAMDKDFPDEMLFQLNVDEPEIDKTFSREGIEGVVDQMDAFVLARVFAFWKRTGKPAHSMRIALVVGLSDDPVGGDDSITAQDLPWFDAGDTGGMHRIDGTHRIPRNKGSS